MRKNRVNVPLKVAAIAAFVVILMTSCQASSRVQVDALTHGGVIRCANGQSFINEYGVDDDPAAFGAGTEARRDLYCVNEDTGPLFWDRIDVRVRKFVGNYQCYESAVYWTSVNRTRTVSHSKVCAPGIAANVWAMGVHGANRPGDPIPRRELSATPDVITQ